MYSFVRNILFRLQAEQAHELTINMLSFAGKIPFVPSLMHSKALTQPVEVFGLKFPNRVGLAAGMDKNAEAYRMFGAMGFGFVEIGTVTPQPQPGNPKPRVFRLVNDQAIINRMGFNSKGVQHAVNNLKNRPEGLIIGGNIGKNKVTPNEKATDDYVTCFEALFDHVDYFAVNVSSPNTPDLRQLQDKQPLTDLLSELQRRNNSRPKSKPILLKIAPDLNTHQLDDIISIVSDTRIAGLIATNTTISRDGLSYNADYVQSLGAGGLSGKPVKSRSTDIIRHIHQQSGGRIPIVGVGGITTAADALEKFEAGASLVQLYTGFVYAGTKLIKDINKVVNF